ncbi:helix-turn-helix domain-containing protein [Paraburkholderia tropica]|uniref:helix-turn-helix domain-containing protein n=1 Tax=Paraburkholderia tropica TaxID=92647 RepID=UPI002AB6F774|nr:winged helix-turn-helix domain-containing protein [Paraburkholderia tropica]
MSTNNTTGPRWSGRRVRAARMLAAGVDIAQVATALDLSPATARRYESVFAAGGPDALMGLGDVGRRPRLTADGLTRLIVAIGQPPRKAGLVAECWTNLLVQRYIEREFQISYSYSHINRLIRDHGLQRWIR